MEVNVATTSFHWSGRHATIPQSPSSSQTLASTKRRRHRELGGDVAGLGSFACHYSSRQRFIASAFLGTQSTKLHRSKSCELWEFSKAAIPNTKTTVRKQNSLRRVCSASSDLFSDEEFSTKMKDLAQTFRIAGGKDDVMKHKGNKNGSEIIHEAADNNYGNFRYGRASLLQESMSGLNSVVMPWPEMVNHSSIEMKANSVNLPHSLRIIKRKLQEQVLKKSSETTYCSVNKAFSSMVFMIDELHSLALQMRETILYEDLQGVLQRVQKEMHASFLWLFQRVFSRTPTSMVSVMVLLAKFTVHSMESDMAIAATDNQNKTHQKLVSPSSKTTTIAKDGGKMQPVPNVADKNGFDWSKRLNDITEEERSLWDSMVKEADKMQNSPVDRDTRLRFFSPISANIELDDDAKYTKTEVVYKMCIAQEPNNPLLLANYAQFLYLVSQDYKRAEECFKKAIESEAVDAEAYSKYAIFLWKAKKDLWAAEENFLEAITADPTSSFHAANYANFLWQTGAEDTCFPLGSPQGMA